MNDDDIPGRPAIASPIGGTLSATDADDVHAIQLKHGDTLTASINGPADADFRLLLYGPWSTSIWDDDPAAGVSTGTYPRTIAYHVWDSGTYYLDAWAVTGSGACQIVYSITPAEADDDVPGLTLPVSPVSATISPAGAYDLYSFSLRAGQSVQFTVFGLLGSEFDLSVYPPGTTTFETATPIAAAYSSGYPQNSLSYLAPTSGVYYLLVDGVRGSGAYVMAHNLDVTPPTTVAVGADDAWHSGPVTVAFAANDAGSGVAFIESSLDGGAWAQGTTCLVSGNAAHTLAFRAVDNAGNVEAAQQLTVRVDAGSPTPLALSKATVKKGKKATLKYRVNDVTPQVTCRIKVYKRARLMKTLKLGLVTANLATSYTWTCKLAPGLYTWKVYATDQAGNTQSKPGTKTLTVK